MLITLLVTLLLSYLGLVLFMWAFQDRFIFFPPPLSSQRKAEIQKKFPASEIQFKTPDGITLKGWVLKSPHPQTDSLVIYFGGNTEEISENLEAMSQLQETSLLLINYRGYGESEGRPSERNLFQDTLTIFDHIGSQSGVDKNKIYVMGRSLGAAMAVYLASQRNIKGLILITPFDSALNLAKKHYPYLPISLLLKHPFNALAIVPKLKMPLLGMIAEKDAVVPLQNSLNLFNRYPGPQTRVILKKADHHNVQDFLEYWEEIQQFLARNY